MAVWSLRLHGVGNASAVELGSAMASIERDGRPWLTIDCGAEGLTAYEALYGGPPDALFVTHVHLDHVAGFERLFVSSYFDPARRGKVRLYVPAPVVPLLQRRVGDYPNVLAEGGANFWDAFQLVPVSDAFWHDGVRLELFPVRHHSPRTSHVLLRVLDEVRPSLLLVEGPEDATPLIDVMLDPGTLDPPHVTGFFTIDAVLAGQWDVAREAFHHLMLPALVLAAFNVSLLARYTRSSVLEVMGNDYVRAARAKGVPEPIVLWRYVLRAALPAIITVVGLLFANILTGAVLVENIFAWPGIGQYAYQAAINLDVPAIAGVSLFIAVVYVTINFVVDVLYGVIDPRIRVM